MHPNKTITWLLGYGGMPITRAENSYLAPTSVLNQQYILAQVSAINPSFLLIFQASISSPPRQGYNGFVRCVEEWEKRTTTVVTTMHSISSACQIPFFSPSFYLVSGLTIPMDTMHI